MDHLPARELDRLQVVGAEIYESVEAEAYTVASAIGQNTAFRRTRRPASELERSILLPAAARGAVRAGMGVDDSGTGLDLVSFDGRSSRRYRPKQVKRGRDGRPYAVVGAGSTLLRTDPEDGLWNVDRWLIGFAFGDDHMLTELFAARIVGCAETTSGPVRLELGPVHPLEPSDTPRGFVSTDEGLPELDANDEQGDTEIG